MSDNQNPTDFDLLKDFPDWSELSPEQQYQYMQDDPEMQRRYLNGDMTARLAFETATKNFVEWQGQQKAAELQEAIAKHSEFLKSLEQPQVIAT